MKQLVLETTRRFGPSKACKLIAYRALQCLAVVEIQDLTLLDAADLPPTATTAGISIRPMDAMEATALASDPVNDLSAVAIERFAGGDQCFAAFAGERLAGYAWFAFGSIPAEHNRGRHPLSGVGFTFPDSMAFMYKGFVRPEFRGQGIYGQVIARALQRLAERNITHLLSTVEWTNYSAINSCRSVGYQSLGLIYRFGYRWKMFTIFPQAATSLGINPRADY